MKRSFIIGLAFIACTGVLRTGLAQAQSPSVAPPQSVVQAQGQAQDPTMGGPVPELVNPNRFIAGVCTVGPRSGDTLFDCTGFGFSASPTNVICQPRNNPSQFINFPDQFACQIIGTTPASGGSVWFKIRRLDAPGAGWGQNLQADILIVQ
jgi:hypothetical protein